MTSIPTALTVAGSDSGGGAGIQADLKTFHQLGVFGTSVVTAITAQNTTGVTEVHPVPPDVVRAQLQALKVDLPPGALKSGMVFDSGIIRAVAEGLEGMEAPFVLDPVMISTSGHRLIDEDAQKTLVEVLVPRATLLTPNLEEARALTGMEVDTEADMERAARELLKSGAGAVLLKGGHLSGGEAVDLLLGEDVHRIWRRSRRDTTDTHGTGCTLSSAITALLARGLPLEEAVDGGLDFLVRALDTAPGLGNGNGPLNHHVNPPGRMV